jgi:2-polyprenyl-3-methyl-5-hydroxy-6-metoxy-1,4-benzoquinol methylase
MNIKENKHKKISCPICKHNLFEKVGLDSNYTIVKCLNCGLTFTNPQPKVKDIYINTEPDAAPGIYPTHRFMANHAKGRVLDVGCGWGQVLKLCKQKKCSVYGIELSKKKVQACKKFTKRMWFGELPKLKFNMKFDTIIMSEVLEHVDVPVEYVKKAYSSLNIDGQLMMSMPNENWILKRAHKCTLAHVPGHHIFFYRKKDIKRILENSGFREIKFYVINRGFYEIWWKTVVIDIAQILAWALQPFGLYLSSNIWVIAKK